MADAFCKNQIKMWAKERESGHIEWVTSDRILHIGINIDGFKEVTISDYNILINHDDDLNVTKVK